LYEIQQQQQQIKLLQTFPQEHSSWISSLIQINPNTLVSASYSGSSVIVIWTKSSKSLYEPMQRITQKETGGGGIERLVVLSQKKEEEEEQFASCSSYPDHSIIIWRRGKGDKEFRIKQKITNVKNVQTLIYIVNELISGSNSYPSSLLQIWSSSSSSSSSSDFVEKQKIETPSTGIVSLCQINRNDSKGRIEFASGHDDGQIMIWSKQQQINGSNHYSLIRTLKPFDEGGVSDLIFINDSGFNHCIIACCLGENKIKVFKGEEGELEEELEHEYVTSLIPMSNGQFASGGGYGNQCLNIWSPSSSSF